MAGKNKLDKKTNDEQRIATEQGKNAWENK